MSEENRKIADRILHDAIEDAGSDEFASRGYALGESLVAFIAKALDEAERRGLKQGREEHKAGCMIAFQRGAEKMRERAAHLVTNWEGKIIPMIDAIRALPLGVSDSEVPLEGSWAGTPYPPIRGETPKETK